MTTEAEIEVAAKIYCDEVLELDRKWNSADLTESDRFSCRQDVKRILEAAEQERARQGSLSLSCDGSGHSTWRCPTCGKSGEDTWGPRTDNVLSLIPRNVLHIQNEVGSTGHKSGFGVSFGGP